jgi:hypothetical protein
MQNLWKCSIMNTIFCVWFRFLLWDEIMEPSSSQFRGTFLSNSVTRKSEFKFSETDNEFAIRFIIWIPFKVSPKILIIMRFRSTSIFRRVWQMAACFPTEFGPSKRTQEPHCASNFFSKNIDKSEKSIRGYWRESPLKTSNLNSHCVIT